MKCFILLAILFVGVVFAQKEEPLHSKEIENFLEMTMETIRKIDSSEGMAGIGKIIQRFEESSVDWQHDEFIMGEMLSIFQDMSQFMESFENHIEKIEVYIQERCSEKN